MSNPGLALVLFLALVTAGAGSRAGDEPAIQVALEVRFVEASDHFARDAGIDYRGFGDDAFVRGTAPSDKAWVATRSDFAVPPLADGDRVLREPKVVTGNGETATLAVEDGRGSTLRLTPRIADDETIGVAVEVDFVAPASDTDDGGSPAVSRRIRTAVSLPDGGSLLLGGLLQDSDTGTGVPGLGRIPLLGRLFRRGASESQERQLVIFVTPTLVDEFGVSHPRWSSPPGRPDGASRERIYRPMPDSKNY